jgi:hypothetical protein
MPPCAYRGVLKEWLRHGCGEERTRDGDDARLGRDAAGELAWPVRRRAGARGACGAGRKRSLWDAQCHVGPRGPGSRNRRGFSHLASRWRRSRPRRTGLGGEGATGRRARRPRAGGRPNTCGRVRTLTHRSPYRERRYPTAATYPRAPIPATIASTAGDTTEWRRHSSRACTLDR